MRRRDLVALLLGALTLAGCGRSSAPATTETLLVRYTALNDFDNFDLDLSLDLALQGVGWRARVPVTTSLSIASGLASGTVTCDLSALDSRDYVVTVFAELHDTDLDCYLSSNAEGESPWRLWTIDLSAPLDIFLLTDMLSTSELSPIARDSDPLVRYELTVLTQKVLNTFFDVMVEPPDVDLSDFEGDHVNFDFTEDCHLRSFSTKALFGLGTRRGSKLDVDLDLRATLDNFGQVDRSTLVLPEGVREQAVPTDSPLAVEYVIASDSPLYSVVCGNVA